MKQSKDKKNRFFGPGFFCRGLGMPAAWVLLGAVLSLAGCSKDLAEGPAGAESEIAASASLPAGLEAEASTKAPVDGSTQMTLYFARSDESSAGTWGGYGTTVLNASRAAGTGSRTLTFTTKQYYLTSGLKTRMTGWYPSFTTYTNGVVSWTINGTQDILCAPVQEGSKTAAMPAFTFSHKLTQLQFYCYAENQAAVDQWGKITAIRVLGQRTACSYTLSTGAFAFSGSTSFLSVSGITAAVPPVGEAIAAAQYGQALMIEPKTAASQLFLEITTEKQGKQAAMIAAKSYPAGQSVKIYIRIAEHTISIDPDGCEIVPWVDPVTVTSGYPFVLEDGSTVVARDVNGYADPDTYPTHEAWTTTPAHTESAWTANASGYNTVGERFQVAKADAMGKDGSSETMTWYEASGTVNATYNAAGYSACAQYSEAGDGSGQGPWRLPTAKEMRVIFEKKSILASAPLSDNDYWTATEGSSSYAWYLYFLNGITNSISKSLTNRVRCVRDVVAPLSPVSADYPKVLDGNTIVVRELAGRADPAAYPTHEAWTTAPAHTESAWDANESGYNTVGKKFRVAKANAVGKDGSSKVMTYWEIIGAYHPTDNPDRYSSCAQYSEATDQSDKGSWRVPTVREVKLIYSQRGKLNSVDFLSGVTYWSVSGDSSDIDKIWAMNFAGSSPASVGRSTTCFLRCVRDL